MGFRSEYEGYECLKITQQEKEALQLYISSRHIDINSILELNPTVIASQSKKGWYIDLSAKRIDNYLDSISKVYSAMYKHSKMNPDGPYDTLYRGTTLDEINGLRSGQTIGRCLSTSIDSDVAMRFTEYQNGAMIAVNVGQGVPYIPMDDFLDDTQISESEVLISPFTKLSEIQEHYSAEGEVKRFTLSLRKSEFSELSDEERNAAISQLENVDITEYVKKLSSLQNELDTLYFKRNNLSMDARDKAQLADDISIKEQEHISLKAEFDKAKSAVHSLIKDRLRQVELSVDRDIAKEREDRTESYRKSEVERILELKDSLNERAEKLLTRLDAISQEYFSKTEEEENMAKLGEENGIVVSDEGKYSHEIEQKFSGLRSNIERIMREIESMNVPETASIQDLRDGKFDDLMNESFSAIEMVETLIPEIEQSISKEKEDLLQGIRANLNSKFSQDIKSAIVSKLQQSKEEITSKKMNILDRITGKAKLREEQLRNLELRIQSVNGIKIEVPEESQAIKEYINNLHSIIAGNDSQITDESVQTIKKLIASDLPVVGNNRMSTKNRIKALHVQNESIRQANGNITIVSEGNINLPPVSDLAGILDNAIYYTGDGKEEREQKQLQKTLGRI